MPGTLPFVAPHSSVGVAPQGLGQGLHVTSYGGSMDWHSYRPLCDKGSSYIPHQYPPRYPLLRDKSAAMCGDNQLRRKMVNKCAVEHGGFRWICGAVANRDRIEAHRLLIANYPAADLASPAGVHPPLIPDLVLPFPVLTVGQELGAYNFFFTMQLVSRRNWRWRKYHGQVESDEVAHLPTSPDGN